MQKRVHTGRPVGGIANRSDPTKPWRTTNGHPTPAGQNPHHPWTSRLLPHEWAQSEMATNLLNGFNTVCHANMWREDPKQTHRNTPPQGQQGARPMPGTTNKTQISTGAPQREQRECTSCGDQGSRFPKFTKLWGLQRGPNRFGIGGT